VKQFSQALTKLGNDADASEVRAEAEEACGSEIDIRSVYQIKSNMKTGRDATTKDKPKASKVAKESKAPKAEKQPKPRKPRKAKTAEVESEEAEHHDVQNDDFWQLQQAGKAIWPSQRVWWQGCCYPIA